jgi:hypothetical protein
LRQRTALGKRSDEIRQPLVSYVAALTHSSKITITICATSSWWQARAY